MDKRTLELQIDFEKPLYVSMEAEPNYLQVTVRDGSLFISEDGLPLNTSNND